MKYEQKCEADYKTECRTVEVNWILTSKKSVKRKRKKLSQSVCCCMTRFQVSVCKTVQETKCITVEVDAGCGWCFSELECKEKCSNSYAGHCKETDKEEACQVYSNDNLHRSWHNHCNFQDATALNKPENGASTLSCKKFPRKICFLMPSQNCSVVDETVCS